MLNGRQYATAAWFSGASARFDHVHRDHEDDEHTGRHIQDVGVNLEGRAGVCYQHHQHSSQQRAGYGAAAPGKRSAADDGRCNRTHVISFSGTRLRHADAGGQHDGRDPVQKACKGIDQVKRLADLDAAEPGHLDA